MQKEIRLLISISILMGLIGCVPYFNQPMKTQPAQLGAVTPIRKELVALPVPKEQIVAAVYKFRDQTGQYKSSENGANWSTAVSQGTTSILLKAIEDSGWFIPIEREGLANLMNERKIIRSSRANYGSETEKSQLLPPLLFAGLVLEGGIISYDANIITGGAGLKYFGAGGSGQYRQDRVTVYLRAISTGNGRILKTVYTSKTILSQKVDAGVFRYVKIKRILEAETGFTYNEPTEMAVKEAIEMAVKALIIEGIVDGLWEVKNPEDANGELVEKYLLEKNINHNSDFFNQYLKPRRHNFGLSAYGGTWLYQGDYNHGEVEPIGGISLLYNTRSHWMLSMGLSHGKLASRYHQQTINSADFTSTYRILPFKDWTPYIHGGLGVITEQNRDFYEIDIPNKVYGQALYGVGLEFLLSNSVGLNLSVSNHYIFSDDLDGKKQGHFDDYFWEGKLGLNLYIDKLWSSKKKNKSKDIDRTYQKFPKKKRGSKIKKPQENGELQVTKSKISQEDDLKIREEKKNPTEDKRKVRKKKRKSRKYKKEKLSLKNGDSGNGDEK